MLAPDEVPTPGPVDLATSVPELHRKRSLTMRQSLASLRLKLWDEEQQKLVGFPDADQIRPHLSLAR